MFEWFVNIDQGAFDETHSAYVDCEALIEDLKGACMEPSFPLPNSWYRDARASH